MAGNEMTQTKEQMQAKIKEMQAILDKMPDEPKTWPQMGDNFYCVMTDGSLYNSRYQNEYHKDLLKRGALKRTKEEAQAVDNFRMAYTKLDAMNGGFEPDWTDDEQYKWFPVYDIVKKKWIPKWTRPYQISKLPHFPTEEMLEQAIEAMGSDMDYLLGSPV